MPALRDGFRSSAGEPAGIPSFLDALFGPHRQWVLEAECAKPEHEKKKWVIERSSGLENPASVVRLFEVCRRCPVRRGCLMDALTEEAYTVVGWWGGTVTSERLPAMRRIAEQLTEAEPMQFENSFSPPTSSAVSGSAMHRADRAELAERVADELEASLPQRIEWWKAKATEIAEQLAAARRAATRRQRRSDSKPGNRRAGRAKLEGSVLPAL